MHGISSDESNFQIFCITAESQLLPVYHLLEISAYVVKFNVTDTDLTTESRQFSVQCGDKRIMRDHYSGNINMTSAASLSEALFGFAPYILSS